jgi:beta-glucosidase
MTGVAAAAVLGLAVAGGTVAPGAAAAPAPGDLAQCPWLDARLPVATRVSELISAMSLDQKIAEMHVEAQTSSGPYAGYEGYAPAVPSLCIPAMTEQDDSQGVGTGATGVTQLPAAVALGSAWSPSLAREYGVVNGEEHWAKGIDMALGPGVNIQRDPRWGRNFEMFSEDPYLSATLGEPDTQGIQSQHVLADVKHYLTYNEETNRNTPADDTVVSVRAMEEIYGPPFQAALVGGQAASVMCSYASYQNQYSCQSPYLLDQLLQDQWGYQGFIRSDGGANHATVASANAGLDQEKGSDFWDNGQLAAAVASGQVSMATINQALVKIFTPMFRLGVFNHPPTGSLADTVTTPAHASFSRQVAEQGTVLLKNDGPVLPLAAGTSVAVIGPDGTASPLTSGGGSASVVPPYQVSPLAGIQAAAGPGAAITSYSGTDPAQAAAAAAGAQVAVVFASDPEAEGKDLANISLPGNQDQMIEAVAAANPDTVVVLNTGGPVLMPWLGQVKSVLEAWYPGQEDGNALAAVLYGQVDPSGHLPETFPASLAQMPTSSPDQWPGLSGEVQYSEGIDVGYRWYDQNDVTPLFPFGYGLSYTTFAFSGLSVSPGSATSLGQVQVGATVTNTGTRAGSDVAQLYVGDPAATGEPPRQLKGYQKVTLAPGQSARVHFTLTGQDLAYWDDTAGAWSVANGGYQVYVGDSSAPAGLPLAGGFQVRASTGSRHVALTAPADARAGTPFTVTATLTAGGDLTLHDAGLTLKAPPGWTVHPATPAGVPVLEGSRPLTASWRVTAPAGAQDNTAQLSATAGYHGTDGSGTSTSYAEVTVASLVTTTLSPGAVLLAPGQAAPVTVTSTNTSGYPLRLDWSAQPPDGSGITTAPASGTATLAPGASTTTQLSVTGDTPGNALVPIAVTAAAGSVRAPGAGAYLQVTTPYPSLAGAYDNVGITDDSDHAPGDFDGDGNSYSAQALAAAGITPGAPVTAGGVTFTWPGVAPGTPDNVVTAGQAIELTGTADTLGFLGDAANGTQSGSGTIYYTDGTTQPFTLEFPDWITATPVNGDVLVATTAYFNRTTAGKARTPSLFAATVALQAGKTVQAITLPSNGNLHVFAAGVG